MLPVQLQSITNKQEATVYAALNSQNFKSSCCVFNIWLNSKAVISSDTNNLQAYYLKHLIIPPNQYDTLASHTNGQTPTY
jgi:hypothetical protein